jgi:hypothetical protein
LNAGHAGKHRDRKQKGPGSPVGIGPAMDAFVRDLGLAGTLAQYDILTAWPDVVGEKIARVTTAQRMDNGVLFIGVRSAAWRNELTLKRLEIIDKLNRRAGSSIVKDIRFR